MKRTITLGISALTAIAVLTGSALSEEPLKRKRKSFFESLFGTSEPRRVRQQSKPWWLQDDEFPSFQNGNRRANLFPRKQPGPAAFVDPEVAEGLGYGKMAYQLPKMAGVFDVSLAKLTTTSPETSAIRLVLADRASPIRAISDIRAAVIEHYKATNFTPLWTKQGQLSDRALTALAFLARSGEEGLDSARYLPVGLESFVDPQSQMDGSSLSAAQIDVGLTVAVSAYARDMSGGALDPSRLSLYNDVKPEPVNAATALRVLAFTPFPDQYLKSLAPANAAYAAFKTALANSYDAPPVDQSFPTGKTIRVGQKDDRIPLLRDRLVEENLITGENAFVDEALANTLDKKLSKALKAYQASKLVAQTGMLDTATVKALNGMDAVQVRERLITNMERLRWLPKDMGRRHVFVNQAAFSVVVMNNGKPEWKSNVIVGKPMTQTAVFNDQIETVVFNPSWGVPQSIILNEYLPKLRRDPGYLDRIGFKVVNQSGKVVSSRAVDWNSIGSNSTIGIQQPPGDGNALGELKFLFPNKHSIYMHDTPNRELFAQSTRAFSHGCVRVENPREFARVLLGWDAGKVDRGVESGQSKAVPLKNPVPVHLTYFTAWPDENGKIVYYSDIYDRDKALQTARAMISNKRPAGATQKLVQNQATAAEAKVE